MQRPIKSSPMPIKNNVLRELWVQSPFLDQGFAIARTRGMLHGLHAQGILDGPAIPVHQPL
jgi:hypothetical protein